MPYFDIVRQVTPVKSFRVASIIGAFSIDTEHITERFSGNIDIDGKEWNVGAIIGGSGTGKSTIAREIFSGFVVSGYEYKEGSVIDDMPKNSISDIELAFTSVGFSSPPSWLKPYSVLSNGEKMRADLARAILSNEDMIVFDEFTSVVNREVAKTGSYAISKAVRSNGKKFVAVSCHKDIVDWLEPDWIYNTDQQQFFFYPKNDRPKRPDIELEIYRVDNTIKKRVWKVFRKYHYLNTNFKTEAHQWVGVMGDDIVCHTGVIQFPLHKGWKRIHRFVVLPDYQGIGIGVKFINAIAKKYIEDGYQMNLTTTTPAIVGALRKSPNWKLIRYGRSTGGSLYKSIHLKHSLSQNRITYSFNYIDKLDI